MRQETQRALWWTWGIAAAIAGAATWALSSWRPGNQALTLSQGHALCSSAIGSFAQAMYPKAVASCGRISTWYEAGTWARVLAIVGAVVVTGVILYQESQRKATAEPPAPVTPAGR